MGKKEKERQRIQRIIELTRRGRQSFRRIKENSKCAWCGTKYNLTIDHIRKKEHGGENERTNVRILCWRCHKRRHEREEPLEYYYLGRRRYILPRNKDENKIIESKGGGEDGKNLS